MERLTKRSNKTVHENGVCCTHFRGKECSERMGECTDNCPWEEAAWSKLADYEDAEEQGLLLRLPVAEGTTVFGIIRYFFRGRNENQYEICECKFELPMLREIGKTIFLTREEAESALAEKGGAE